MSDAAFKREQIGTRFREEDRLYEIYESEDDGAGVNVADSERGGITLIKPRGNRLLWSLFNTNNAFLHSKNIDIGVN